MYKSFLLYFISFVFLQLIPAVFLDIILYIVKKRTWFVRMQLKTYKKLKLFSFFVCKTWTWDNSNTKTLYNQIDVEERLYEKKKFCFLFYFIKSNIFFFSLYFFVFLLFRESFNFLADHMNIRKYFWNWHYGVRKYLLHINEIATDSAKSKLKILYCLDLIVKTAFFAYTGYLIIKLLGCEHLLPIAHYGACGACCGIYDYKCASTTLKM